MAAVALLAFGGTATGSAVAAAPAGPAVRTTAPAVKGPGPGLVAASLPPGDGSLLGTVQAARHTTRAFGMRQQLVGGKGVRQIPLLLSVDDRDGRGWREVPLPALSGSSRLNAAATVPNRHGSVRDGWLVGDDVAALGGVLTEHWDRGAWRVLAAPLPDKASGGGLLSVSALAPDDVWASGWAQVTDSERPDPDKPGGTIVVDHFEALVEHWDGGAWRRIALPDPVGYVVNSVVALGPDDVWTAGYASDDHPALRHFDGHAWNTAPLPATGLYGEINQLAADASGTVWAAGRTLLDENDRGHALVLRLRGGQWRTVAVPAAVGQLSALAVTPGGVTVVGTTAAQDDACALRLTGDRWRPLPLPTTGAAYRFLTGVSVGPNRLTLAGGSGSDTAMFPQPMVLTGPR